MTLDELKAEMTTLLARIDDDLAEEIRREYDRPNPPFDGQCFEAVKLLPADLTDLPEHGYRIRLALSAWFLPVVFNDVEAESNGG